MNHRTGGLVFALGVGVFVAVFSYRWISDPARGVERQQQEAAVQAAREELRAIVGNSAIEIVDPLAPNRKVGKVYIYPDGAGWQVSGFYRRDRDDDWHPYLMTLSATRALQHLKVRDDGLLDEAWEDSRLEALR